MAASLCTQTLEVGKVTELLQDVSDTGHLRMRLQLGQLQKRSMPRTGTRRSCG